MTYSNEIDPKLPICPDELATGQCPRGAECMYQHFDKMQAPGTFPIPSQQNAVEDLAGKGN